MKKNERITKLNLIKRIEDNRFHHTSTKGVVDFPRYILIFPRVLKAVFSQGRDDKSDLKPVFVWLLS